ncbi:hypothetical protein [Mesobacillus subterraneus]|uniref:Uncharacterized protein n=1 Tax=Mesobacillus subterraneus TaxID=285983 RepID=A0A3R9EBX8_9BACI|nr:hypothetical protein [Mesobacillus subterraneus]RSD28397.1 hypothetical protein EJA10_04750 [Mesobacillus subterraneus]
MTLRKIFNIIGIFIFGGIALTNVTSPVPDKYFIGFVLFNVGSAILYFFLVNIYFIGGVWRKVFYAVLSLIAVTSLVIAVYLWATQVPH